MGDASGSVRSIQIGLRGGPKWLMLDREFLRCVTDVTDRFVAAGRALEAGDRPTAVAALWPSADEAERVLAVPPQVRKVLQMEMAEKEMVVNEETHGDCNKDKST